jgi:protein SCO1/2
MALSRRSFLLAAAAAGLPSVARAHDEHKHNDHSAHAPMSGEAKADKVGAIKVDVGDTPLLDQDGRTVRVRSDVLAGRVVVVDFIYTTCTTICPIFSATMAELRKRLVAAPARDIVLVTVTVDPLRDTPRRLKDYAARFGPLGDGWIWLTGSKSNVDIVNKAFGAYTANIDDHPPMVIVGDVDAGVWTRFYGFPGALELEARARELVAARLRPA